MKNPNRKNWTKIEDRKLFELLRHYEEPYDWDEIALVMKNFGFCRNPKQIKSRWTNNLNPELSKDKWQKEDICRLLSLIDTYGNRWQEISQQFPGRTDNCIKNQLFSSIRKGLRSIIKELGVETGHSYTSLINQIKPKILINFLEHRIKYKVSNESDETVELNASDLLKTFIFKSRKNCPLNPLYENKEVMKKFIEVLIDMNNKYMNNKHLGQTDIMEDKVIGNKFKETSVDNINDIITTCIKSKPAVSKDESPTECFCSQTNRPVYSKIDNILGELKKTLDEKAKISSYAHDLNSMTQKFISIFRRLGSLSDLLITEMLVSGPLSTEEMTKIQRFFRQIEFKPNDNINFCEGSSIKNFADLEASIRKATEVTDVAETVFKLSEPAESETRPPQIILNINKIPFLQKNHNEYKI